MTLTGIIFTINVSNCQLAISVTSPNKDSSVFLGQAKIVPERDFRAVLEELHFCREFVNTESTSAPYKNLVFIIEGETIVPTPYFLYLLFKVELLGIVQIFLMAQPKLVFIIHPAAIDPLDSYENRVFSPGKDLFRRINIQFLGA